MGDKRPSFPQLTRDRLQGVIYTPSSCKSKISQDLAWICPQLGCFPFLTLILTSLPAPSGSISSKTYESLHLGVSVGVSSLRDIRALAQVSSCVHGDRN